MQIQRIRICDITVSESSASLEESDAETRTQMLKELEQAGVKVEWDLTPITATQDVVYFLRCPEAKRIKIGWTSTWAVRFRTHATSCPFRLEVMKVIPGGRDVEMAIHKRFNHIRTLNEWFLETEELTQYISTLP